MYKIKELLKEKGISQKELAEKLGMTPVGVSKAINGTTSRATMKKIANILGIEVSDLYCDDRVVK